MLKSGVSTCASLVDCVSTGKLSEGTQAYLGCVLCGVCCVGVQVATDVAARGLDILTSSE